jgi:hypothetical protein
MFFVRYKAQGPEDRDTPWIKPTRIRYILLFGEGFYFYFSICMQAGRDRERAPFLFVAPSAPFQVKFGEDTVELLLGQRLRTHRCRH